MAVAAYFVVPCHWIPIALDPEFTGWVAPVAARFADGMRLYTDGGHSPLPPLSFVAVYLGSLGRPIWWHESALNFACQCIAVFASFGAARRIVPDDAALVVALGTLAIFLALAKTLLYDSLAQAGVAVLGFTMLRWSETRSLGTLAAAALAGSVAALAKHNTGGAALLGAGLVTLVVRRDIRGSLTFIVATLTCILTFLVLITPFADPHGMLIDVFLNGSEPKGGSQVLLDNLAAYRSELISWPREPLLMRLGLYGTLACIMAAAARRGPKAAQQLGVLGFVFFPAAIAHSLSTALFRWTYDNNPLIAVAIGTLVVALVSVHRRWGAIAAAALVTYLACSSVAAVVERTSVCTESWPSVPYLRGALMPTRAAPLRALGEEIRRHSAPNDTVLLLPEDPDLFATFDRPRPHLTSAIVYVDQYWDRFVNYDLRRLRMQPPAVIVLATNAMRFAQTFFDGTGHRVLRLMAGVERIILPFRYKYEGERRYLRADGREDFVRIYVRR